MPIVGGLDIHRKQITFDYLGTVTGQVRRGQVSSADRVHLRAWLARFAGREDVAFAVEGAPGRCAPLVTRPPARSQNPAAIRHREQIQPPHRPVQP